MSDLVNVWQIALEEKPRECPHLEKLLSPDEHERARRFRQAADRFSFIQRRAWLRQILAGVTGIEAERLELGIALQGKPILLNGPLDLFFNMTRSRNLALCVVSRGEPVGIDLEWMDPTLEFLPLAAERFSHAEYSMLSVAPSHRQRSLFYCLWTAKEAFLKGIGCGLSVSLRDVEMTLEDSVLGVGSIGFQGRVGEAWRMISLPMLPNYFAMLAMPRMAQLVLCTISPAQSCYAA